MVIAGSTSGVGKTSITSAIIYGLKKRGFSVQPFKVGPDYIDPSYLSSISKNETKNLVRKIQINQISEINEFCFKIFVFYSVFLPTELNFSFFS